MRRSGAANDYRFEGEITFSSPVDACQLSIELAPEFAEPGTYFLELEIGKEVMSSYCLRLRERKGKKK